MIQTPTVLTNGENGTGNTNASTASISPGAGRLILVAVASKKNGSNPNQPTVTGLGLTWDVVATSLDSTDQRLRITLFRAMSASTPTPGALTIDFGGQTQERMSWIVAEIAGVKKSGTNGADAIVQSATAINHSATSLTATLAAFSNSINATLGVITTINSGGAITPGSGFSEIYEQNTAETIIEMEFQNANDTSVDWSWASSTNGACLAVELGAGQTFSGAMI